MLIMGLILALAPHAAWADAKADAEKWVTYGKQQMQSNQVDQAIGSFNNALKLDKSSATAYQGLGSCYWAKGDKTNALTYYKYSLQMNPNNPSLKSFVDSQSGGAAPAAAPAAAGADKYLPMGNSYLQAKQYDYAIWAFNKSLESNPSNAKAYQGLGNAYFAKGDKAKAIDAWDKAVAQDPSNTQLKAYVDSLRGPAQAAGESGPPSAPATGNTYIMVAAVVAMGALMIFLF
jgi:tetratricopeptide (TPR) repeat protein